MMYFGYLILCSFFVASLAAKSVDDLYDLMARIDENLRKEDKIRELTQARIDAILKNIDNTLNSVKEKLNEDNDLGRQLPADIRNNLKTIENRMEKMEFVIESLQGMITNMDTDMKKLEEIEQGTENLKRELNHKLTKMMNIISSLYQMNKELKNSLEIPKIEHKNPETDLSLSNTNYLVETMEDMEKKVKEQLSILSVELRNELDALKALTSTLVYQENSVEEEDIGEPGNHKRGRKSADNNIELNNLMRNFSGSQREIIQEFQAGMQNLEDKITHLTDMTSQNLCSSSNEISKTEEILPTENSKENKCDSSFYVTNPQNCAELRQTGTTCDGIYILFYQGIKAIRVYCDMTTDGGGWTVIMRRGDYGTKDITFHQNWYGYKHGFGDLEGEFWLGNDNIHLLTNQNQINQLRIELYSFANTSKNFTVGSFKIDDEINDYRLHVKDSPKKRTAFSHYDNRPFITYDRIMDQPGDNCAEKYKGAWWFRRYCMYTVLTAERLGPGIRTSMVGMQSQLWREAGILQAAEMKIRPANFRV